MDELVRATPDHLPAIGELLERQGLGGLEWWPRARPSERLDVSLTELDERLATGRAVYVRVGPGGRARGVLWVDDLAWDTAFFGVPRAQVGLFAYEREALAQGVDDLRRLLRARGTGHAHMALDAGRVDTLVALQTGGWRLVWTYLRMTCVLSSPRAHPPLDAYHKRPLRLVPARAEHIEALADIAARSGRWAWCEDDEALPAEARSRYTETLIRNALSGACADFAFTLLDGEQVVGADASALRHVEVGARTLRVAYERFSLVDAERRGRRLGSFLMRGVVRLLEGRVDVVTGQVRVHAPHMLRALLGQGFVPAGANHYLTLALPASGRGPILASTSSE